MNSMHIGWRDYIKGRFKKASLFHSIGIEFNTGYLHLSVFKKVNATIVCVKQHAIPIEFWQEDLKTYVLENKLSNTLCNVTLAISKYQLLQVDTPPVEESEINSALKWAIKEQLADDSEMVVDYFDPPAATNSKKLNVVAIAKQEIIDIRNGVLGADLTLNTIEVQELTICNLFTNSEDAIISLQQDPNGQISLSIVKQKMLFFSRRLKGYENLANFSPDELKMGIADNLSLEIQRSMDYFESQLRQAPVKKVYISVNTKYQDVLVNMIKDVIFVPVEVFTPDIPASDDIVIEASSFASLAAAMGNMSSQTT
ncbi:type IV pilus biogenesis protein PilM [Paraglaciecola sp. 2405UD69-4]|uniref:type IV pilus biogenesis protein PilM n=1 Tax=Paraglaciecola sp. 2405UD69-4 TaxID=3391836 RepID=UPI0039C9B9CD